MKAKLKICAQGTERLRQKSQTGTLIAEIAQTSVQPINQTIASLRQINKAKN